MAIIKHVAIKNANYGAAEDYLTMQHDERHMTPVLGEDGRTLPREEYLFDGINCNPYTFAQECEATNAAFHKNQNKNEVKAHHYIISFDPRDRDENNLTLESAQRLGLEFAKRNFPGHQTLVCAHPDGHNSAGNIHVHIVINSVRAFDTEMHDFMERECDAKAGYKHHVTDKFLAHLKQETMTMCQENSLYQVDLLSPAKVRITDREYWAKRKGQEKFDSEYESQILGGAAPGEIERKEYKTDKDFLRDAITTTLDSVAAMFLFPQVNNPPADERKKRFKTFSEKLYEDYGIEVTESRDRIGYILPDHTKPIRGRMLGTDFEKEHILAVLADPETWLKSRESKDTENAKRQETDQNHKYEPAGIRLITDLETCLKAQQNQYYARKVKITNLQQMAKTLSFLQANDIGSVEELDSLLTATKADVTDKHAVLKSVEAEIRTTNLLIKNTGQYLANKDTYRRYMNAPNKAAFYEEHRAEITLYEAARKYLKENGYLQKNGSYIPNIKKLKEHKETLTARKNALYEDYSYSCAKYRELQTVHQNVHSILDIGMVDKTQSKEKTAKQEQSL